MALYTIYSGADDHQVQSVSTVYSTARSGGGTKYNDTGDLSKVGQWFTSPTYTCEEVFLEFDTSGVPVGVPTTNVTLKFTVQTAPTSPSTITVNVGEKTIAGGIGDFVAGASLSGITDFGSVSISSTGVKTVTGLADVARSSGYGLMLWSSRHEAGTTPTADERANIYSSKASGTSNDPYLTMSVPLAYSMSAAAGSFTLIGQDIKYLRVVADAGAISLTGIDTPLRYGKVFPADEGAFTLTGQDVSFPILRNPPQVRTITFPLSTIDGTRTLIL